MVRPNGPVLVQRSFHSDQYNTSTRSSCPVGLRRATSAPELARECVAAIATLGAQLAATAVEGLDALDDRIGHAGHDRPLANYRGKLLRRWCDSTLPLG